MDATIAATAGNQVITVSSIESALAGGDVVVTTVGTTGTQTGNIAVASSLSWANANTLTLNAYRDITVNSGVTISNTGAGNLVLRADATGTEVGTVNFNGNGKIDFSGSTGTISIFYNPTDNPAGSVVNPTSYTMPFDYTPYVVTNGAIQNQLTAYMLVNSVYDLQNIENNLSGDYALGKNIDASATAGWNGGAGFLPIGMNSAFTGTLNGNDNTISNLTINLPSSVYVGLFGIVGTGGMVQNLGLLGGNVGGSEYVGGLIGVNYGTVSNTYATGAVSAKAGVGGLIGFNYGTVNYAYATGAVTGSSEEAGGLIGYNDGRYATPSNRGSDAR